jgi:hypothetical protein
MSLKLLNSTTYHNTMDKFLCLGLLSKCLKSGDPWSEETITQPDEYASKYTEAQPETKQHGQSY